MLLANASEACGSTLPLFLLVESRQGWNVAVVRLCKLALRMKFSVPDALRSVASEGNVSHGPPRKSSAPVLLHVRTNQTCSRLRLLSGVIVPSSLLSCSSRRQRTSKTP